MSMTALEQSKAIAEQVMTTAARCADRLILPRDSPGLEAGDWYVVPSGKYLVLWECTDTTPGFVARFEMLKRPVCVHVRLGTGDLQSVLDLGTPAGVVCRLWHETKVDTVTLVRLPADKAYVAGRMLAAVYAAGVLRFQRKAKRAIALVEQKTKGE